jgi:Zn finger protein HypA/HybF involved in hydrogenase expression
MSTHLKCTDCNHKFVASTIEFMAGKVVCPNCGSTGKKDKNGRTIYVQ